MANNNDHALIIQIYSDSYAGSCLIQYDCNRQNENGKYLDNFMRRNTTLVIVNGMSICQGNMTKQRITTIREE